MINGVLYFWMAIDYLLLVILVIPSCHGLSNLYRSSNAATSPKSLRQPLTLSPPLLPNGDGESSLRSRPLLQLEPMLGKYPPHRASAEAPLTNVANLESVIKNDDNKTTRMPFSPNAEVHILRSAWSPEACCMAIDAAAEHSGWSTGRHHLFPTTDIPARDLPGGMGPKALDLATEVILPAIARAFDTPVERLNFKDMFLAKYEPTGQPGLGRHTDGSAFSFNMLLSDPVSDFEGGGTWIEPVGLVRPRMGDVLMHRGSLLHEGCKVTKGSRHVLVGFVQSEEGAVVENTKNNEKSELLYKTVETFPLGMVLEVDEGDAISCAIVTDVVENGAASKAGVQKGDCIRGIYVHSIVDDDDERYGDFIKFDGLSFDSLMDIIAGRRNFGPFHMVVERWCR